MKQIIKAIWKSNEVPTNEYFLWLKYEYGSFILYVRGQSGWEPITSPGQISDTYTKAEIDALLENYYTTTESDDLYLPLSAGETKPLTGTLYSKAIRPTSNALALGVRDEHYKFVPYIYPARTFYDSGRWGVKRVLTYTGDSSQTVAVTGIFSLEIPAVPTIKYKITINEVYENAKMIVIDTYIYQSNITVPTIHSAVSTQYGTETISVRTAKKGNKNYLWIGTTGSTYAPLTMVEIDAITTVTGSVTVDDVHTLLQPAIVTAEDESEYSNIVTL